MQTKIISRKHLVTDYSNTELGHEEIGYVREIVIGDYIKYMWIFPYRNRVHAGIQDDEENAFKALRLKYLQEEVKSSREEKKGPGE